MVNKLVRENHRLQCYSNENTTDGKERNNRMQQITPHLWFDKEAKEAAEFYTSVLPDSQVTHITTLHDTPSGESDVVSFEHAPGFPAADLHDDAFGDSSTA